MQGHEAIDTRANLASGVLQEHFRRVLMHGAMSEQARSERGRDDLRRTGRLNNVHEELAKKHGSEWTDRGVTLPDGTCAAKVEVHAPGTH